MMKKKIYQMPQSCQIDLTLQGIVAQSGGAATYDIVKDADAEQLSNKREPSHGIWSHMRED